MPSTYKTKQLRSVSKQTPILKDLSIRAYEQEKQKPVCTNCGAKSPLQNPQYSKCYCGGTYQLYGVKKGSI